MIREFWAEGIDPETLASAECAIDLDSDEAKCPACSESFPTTARRCPSCGLRFG